MYKCDVSDREQVCAVADQIRKEVGAREIAALLTTGWPSHCAREQRRGGEGQAPSRLDGVRRSQVSCTQIVGN